MPFVELEVTADKFPLQIPSTSACPAGHSGVPIFINLVNSQGFNGLPVTDVVIEFSVKADEVHGDKAAIDADSISYTFKIGSPIHSFSYTCNEGIIDG